MRLKEYPIGDYVDKCQTWNPKSSGAGSFDYIDLSSVDKDTKSIASIERYECSDAPSRARQLVETDDVLVATVRPNLNGVALVNGAHHGMTASTGYCVLRPDKDKLDSRFLFHWVKTGVFVQRMVDVATGANYPAVSDAKVKASKIPLPPIAEQTRIAAILDAADALRAKRRECIAQLDTLLQATFLDMFGDPVTNPKGWDTCLFDEIGDFVSGGTPSKAREDYWVGSVPWVSPKDMKVSEVFDSQDHVSESVFEETNLKLLGPGHLLIVVRGMILAHSFPVAINRVAVAINQDMKRIAPSSGIDVRFLMECVRHTKRQILSEVSTAAHGTKRFDAAGMRKIPVPIPPLDLQRRFAAIVESVERQKASQRVHLAELDNLFASLEARAFRGDL